MKTKMKPETIAQVLRIVCLHVYQNNTVLTEICCMRSLRRGLKLNHRHFKMTKTLKFLHGTLYWHCSYSFRKKIDWQVKAGELTGRDAGSPKPETRLSILLRKVFVAQVKLMVLIDRLFHGLRVRYPWSIRMAVLWVVIQVCSTPIYMVQCTHLIATLELLQSCSRPSI